MRPEAGEILFLSRKDIERILNPTDCVNRCLETFKWIGEGLIEQKNPISIQVTPDNNFQGSGFLQSYPALVKPLKIGGNKWLGGYPGNIALGLPV
ncbi:MAG: hypothetical protein DRP87_15115, partial [Spirochaetes bacterium]